MRSLIGHKNDSKDVVTDPQYVPYCLGHLKSNWLVPGIPVYWGIQPRDFGGSIWRECLPCTPGPTYILFALYI